MAVGHLLSAPASIVDELPTILSAHGIQVGQIDRSSVTSGRRIVDLTGFRCNDDTTAIELGVEQRRGRDTVDIVLIPDRRVFFLRDNQSEMLAERIAKILCENGADDTP